MNISACKGCRKVHWLALPLHSNSKKLPDLNALWNALNTK